MTSAPSRARLRLLMASKSIAMELPSRNSYNRPLSSPPGGEGNRARWGPWEQERGPRYLRHRTRRVRKGLLGKGASPGAGAVQADEAPPSPVSRRVDGMMARHASHRRDRLIRRESWRRCSEAIYEQVRATLTPVALRLTQGISTRPATGSQTRPSRLWIDDRGGGGALARRAAGELGHGRGGHRGRGAGLRLASSLSAGKPSRRAGPGPEAHGGGGKQRHDASALRAPALVSHGEDSGGQDAAGERR